MKSLSFPFIVLFGLASTSLFSNLSGPGSVSMEPMKKGFLYQLFQQELSVDQYDSNHLFEWMGPDDIEGQVWEDWNYNGLMDEFDTLGVAGVEVQLINCNGNLVGSAVTDQSGNYVLNGTNTSFSDNVSDHYRLEFIIPASLSWYQPTSMGDDNGSTIQFVQQGDVAHLGVSTAASFCQSNAPLTTNCYIVGDNTGVGDVLLSFNSQNPMSFQHEAVANQIGTTYGLAYQRASGQLFASSYLKRFAGLKGSTGAIFKITQPADGMIAGEEFIDLNDLFGSEVAGADPHDFTKVNAVGDAIDSLTFSRVTTRSFGDMDISADERSLWVVNLFDRSLYNIPLGNDPANPVAPSSSNEVKVIPLTDGDISGSNPLPNLPAGISDAEISPFALKVKGDFVYIGLVTNGVDGGPLKALVYSYHVENETFNKVLDFALDYNRGCALSFLSNCFGAANWNAWVSTYPSSTSVALFVEHGHPQPILADIEFDVYGNMLLGIRDRFGDQTGYRQPRPDGQITLYTGEGYGDILKATPNSSGGWDMDIAAFTDNTESVNGEGANNHEAFFGEDFFEGGNDLHEEIAMGGLASLPGSDQFVVTVMDPIVSFSAGVQWYNSVNGQLDYGFELLEQASQFNKANGLGELEVLCDPAPISIGNYVWMDIDNDGVQDPCEEGLANVRVDLYDANGIFTATTFTDQDGYYIFSHKDSIGQEWDAGEQVTANSMYFIVVGQGQFSNQELSLNGIQYTLTTDSTNAGANRYSIDSDGTIANGVDDDFDGLPFVKITTGDWGATDYSLDFGFYDCLQTGSIINEAFCAGTIFTYNAIDYSQPGTYYDTLLNEAGCDSIITLNLLGIPAPAPMMEDATICTGEQFFLDAGTGYVNYQWSNGVGNQSMNEVGPGTYTVTVTALNGCTGEATATVTGIPVKTSFISSSVCSTFVINNEFIYQAGIYFDTLTASNGCDSIITYNLTNIGEVEQVIDVSLCDGQTFSFNNESISDPGTYRDTTLANNGCDSIIIVHVDVLATEERTIDAEICPNETYDFGGNTLTTAGTYFDTIAYVGSGCDSIRTTLHLSAVPVCVEPVFDLALRKTLAPGQNSLVDIGDKAKFTISVFNQGDFPAYNILIVDYLPFGLSFSQGGSPGWLDFGAGPTWFYAGPLQPGASDSIQIEVTVNIHAAAGALLNYAEIISADDNINGSDTPPTDHDSTPNAFFGDDPGGEPGTPADDAIDGDGTGAIGSNNPFTDEDDMDGAELHLNVPTLTLGNLVFNDKENDGEFNNNDTGIPLVEVALYDAGDDGLKGTADDMYLDAVLTDTDGTYLFTLFEEGDYYVQINEDALPVDYVSSTGEGIYDNDADGPFEPSTGTDNNIDDTDDGTQMNGIIMSEIIDLKFGSEPSGAENNDNLTVDFGFYEPELFDKLVVGNLVFHDMENDGVFNNNDTGLMEVNLQLFNLGLDEIKGTGDDELVGTEKTDQFGIYSFDNVDGGLYYIQLTGEGIPTDFISSTGDNVYDMDGAGAFEPSLNTDNDLDNLDDGTQMGAMIMSDTFRLVYGTEPDLDTNYTIDFGLYLPEDLPTNSLGNLVFNDIENNGVFDGNDVGIEGVEVALYSVGPDGDKGTGDDVLDSTLLTDAFGHYLFTELLQGVYYVKLTGLGIPNTFVSSTGQGMYDNDGMGPYEPVFNTNNDEDQVDDGTQMGAMIMSDTIRLSWFGEPEVNTNNTVDFGLYEPQELQLGNLVFSDFENDGIFNNNDLGLADVEVALYNVGSDGLKGTVDDMELSTQMTGSSGTYLFTGLVEGTYYVVLTGNGIPTNYISSTGDGIYDMDGAGAFEPALMTDNNVDQADDGTQMGQLIMSDTIQLSIGDEPDGNLNTTVDFGLYEPQIPPSVLLGNLVFQDMENDGLFNFNDQGIADVVVELYDLGIDGVKNTNDDNLIDSKETDANGFYEFQLFTEGLYYVKLSGEGIPAGLISSTGDGLYDYDGAGTFEPSLGTDNNTDQVDDGSQMGSMIMSDTIRLTFGGEPGGSVNSTVDFGLYDPLDADILSLGDLVFHDINNDGVFNQMDHGLPAVAVQLFEVGADGLKGTADDVLSGIRVTDDNGKYLFPNLLPGLYYIQLLGPGIPTGYVSSTGQGIYDNDADGPFEPSTGTDNNVNDTDDGTQMGALIMSDTIRLVIGEEPAINENLTVDFGLYEPQDVPTMSIGNLVFHDLDNDGVYNNNDTGLVAINLEVFDLGIDGIKGTSDDMSWGETTTEQDGSYLFENLLEGVYYVILYDNGLPAGMISSTGDGPYDLDATGIFEPSTGTDNDVDQTDDGTQMGLQIMSDTLRLTINSEPSVNINNTVDFGLFIPQTPPVLSIGNLVFQDVENDGVYNNNDLGVPDVELELYTLGLDGIKGTGDDEYVANTSTNSNGEYTFVSLFEGLYYVKLTGFGIPLNWVSSTGDGIYDQDGSGAYEPYSGTNNDQDQTDDGSQMGTMIMSDTIRLVYENEPDVNVNNTVDFGLYEPQDLPTLSLGNQIFHDLDNDGLFNHNDTGMASVLVQLFEIGLDGQKGTSDDLFVEEILSSSDGTYLFEGLPDGTYYVQLNGQGYSVEYVSSTGDGIYDADGAGAFEPYFGTDNNEDHNDDGSQMGAIIMSDTIKLSIFEEPGIHENTTVDFGLYIPAEIPTVSVGNLVFTDFENDGIYNNNDLGIEGVEVELWDTGSDGLKGTNDDVKIATETTNISGEYGFDGLPEGLYYIQLNGIGVPADYISSTGDGIFDQDGSGAFEPANLTDNNIDHQDDGTQMGSIIMSDTIRLTLGQEPDGDDNSTVDFGLYEPQDAPTMSLGNLVFEDINNNGIYSNDEPGIGGVELVLFEIGPDGIKNTADDISMGTQTSTGTGGYLFTGLSEGVYYVQLSGTGIPTGYVSSTGEGVFDNDASGPYEPYSGSDNNMDHEDDGTQMGQLIMSDTLRLTLNEEPQINVNPTIDFGLYLPLSYASLGDQVWYDTNRDGQKGSGEIGVSDVVVQIFDLGMDGVKGTNDDQLIETTQTDTNGNYDFTGLVPGDYYVMISLNSLPDNYSITLQDEGDDNSDNDFNAMGMSSVITLNSGEDNPSIDAGIAPGFGAIGNYVWFDLDHNGQQNNEPGVAGLPVALYDLGMDGVKGGGDDVLIASTLTNLQGNYQFNGLEAGDYYIQFDISNYLGTYTPTQQSSGNDTSLDSDANSMGMTAVIQLGIGEENTTIDLGLEPELAQLGDYVWYDLDHDGIQDMNEEGVEGLIVTLYGLGLDGVKGGGDDVEFQSVMTGSNGYYELPNIEPGAYYVQFDLSAFTNYDAAPQDQGNDGLDSDGNSMGMTDVIQLSPGENNTSIDFGLQPQLASIGDLVWYDADVDGQQELSAPGSNEYGIADVQVRIYNLGIDEQKGGGDDEEMGAATTDSNGFYEIGGLEPGFYYVVFEESSYPAGFSMSLPNIGNEATNSDVEMMGMTSVFELLAGEHNPDIDAGLYNPMFDLSLSKKLASGQPNMVNINDEIHYQITITNEGLTDAYNVLVTDHIPAGLSLSPNENNWTLLNDSTATYTIAGPIAANGGSMVIDVLMVVRYGFSGASLQNIAEVDSATDINGVTVNDIDSTPNNENPNEDDIDEEEIILLDHDPTGWIYCEKTGRIISGGTIQVVGPNGIPNTEVVILADGSTGYYEFFAVGATGTYTIQYNHPNGYPLSVDCPPGGILDPTGLADPVVLGSLEDNGFLSDTACTANPYYLQFDLEIGDPAIFANNIPIRCAYIGSIVCEDSNNNDQVDISDQRIVGATVNLYNCGDPNNIVASVLTDAQGRYAFDGLTPGSYMVGYDLPANTRFVSSGPINTNGFSDCITLDWGDCDTTKTICRYICPSVQADDLTICFGGSATLSATVPYGTGMFSWTPGTDLVNENTATPTASPNTSSTYMVNYSDGLGCLSADDATVFVRNTGPYFVYTPFVEQTVECTDPIPFEAPIFADSCDMNLVVTLDSTVLAPGCGQTITRVWTATNQQGNVISFTQTVNVVDNTPPIMEANHRIFGIINHGDTIYANCEDYASLDSLGFLAFDQCCARTITFEEEVTPGDCLTDGYLERRYCGWTATDCCGNTDSLYFTLFVQDLTPPVLSSTPADVTVDCDNIPAAPGITATDNCSANVSVDMHETSWGDPTSGCRLIMRMWTATDDCGNTTTATQNILIQDFEPPVLVNVPASGITDCSDPETPVVTAVDNCDTDVEVTLVENIISDGNGCVTQIQRTWTAFDGCGNTSFATQTLIVQNNEGPEMVITHPMFLGYQHGDNIELECNQVAVLTEDDVVATADCCGAATIAFFENVINGNCETDGYLMQMTCGWTATDCCGNVDSLFLNITVVDNTPPVLENVPADMMYTCLGDAPMPPPITGSDNCNGAVAIAFNEQTEFVGSTLQTTRTWTATDECGNEASQSQVITYAPQNPPLILNVPADITIASTSDVPDPDANVLATDECDPAPALSVVDVPTGSGCCYYITRTWTALNADGLTATESQVITILDETPPTIVGVGADLTVECEFVEVIFNPIAVTDNCTANPVVSFSQDTTFNTCGYIIHRSWTATDECANVTNENQYITVTDTTPPSTFATHSFFGEIQHGDLLFADCSQIASLDSLGFASTDNCGGEVTRTFDETVLPGVCSVDGFIERRYCGWTVTDECGNRDSLFFTVLISDYHAPELVGVPADTLVNCHDVPGNDAIVSAIDNCNTDFTIEYQETIGAEICPGNYTITRTWTTVDDCGNIGSADQVLTVIDTTPPSTYAFHAFYGEIKHGDELFATCSQISFLDSVGFESFDLCSEVTRTFEETVERGNCQNDGFVEQRYCGWTVTDECGNSDSLYFTVNIIDNFAPFIEGVPADLTVDCDDVPPNDAIVTAIDNCYDAVEVFYNYDSIPGTCIGSYELRRNWTATDSCGNSATRTQRITVVNETPPTMMANHVLFGEIFHGDTIYADCTQIPSLDSIGFVAYDDCCATDITFEEDLIQGDCKADGFIEKRYCGWTATDCCGNSDSLYFTIIVQDLEGPTFEGVPFDTTVLCGNVPLLLDVTVNDNCTDVPFVYTVEFINRLDCPFTVTRVWIAEDDCGNVSMDTQYIFVVNELALDFEFVNPSLAGAEDGDTIFVECSSPELFDADDAIVSSDCDQFDYHFEENTFATGDCEEDGYIVILSNTWTATDSCGNDTSVTLFIHYVDTNPPVFSNLPADITLSCGDVNPGFGQPTATDACGEVEVSQNDETILTGTGTDMTRTWRAKDECGNAASYTQTIHILNNQVPVLDNIIVSPEICEGANGSAIVMVQGPAADFEYSWVPNLGTNTDTIGNSRTNLPSGVYLVTIQDGPCQETYELTVLDQCDCEMATVSSIDIVDATCGINDGIATINIVEDLNNYDFTWVPDVGVSTPNGNIHAEIPAGHYVVFIRHDGNNDCVAKIEFDVMDDCNICPPVFDEVAMTAAVSGDVLGTVCLPVPYGVSVNKSILVNGQPYNGPLNGCMEESVKSYAYNALPGMGQSGPYSVVWEHSGLVFSTVVEDMDQLAAKMSQTDMNGQWQNDTKAFQLISRNLTGNYGGLYVYTIATEEDTYLSPADGLADMGTIMEFPFGQQEIAVIDSAGLCQQNLQLLLEPAEAAVFASDSLILSVPCDNGVFDYCFELPVSVFDEFTFELNDEPIDDLLEVCAYEMQHVYSVNTIQSYAPPFQIDMWSVNGQSHTGTFNSMDELADQLNLWDSFGTWALDANNALIIGGDENTDYSSLVLTHTLTGTTFQLSVSTMTTPTRYGIQLEPGTHQLSGTHLATGLSDDITILLACVTDDIVTILMPVGSTDTFCLDLGELPGDIDDIVELCDSNQISNAIIETIPGTFCVDIQGIAFGTSQSCFVICDDNGFCDTTYLKLRVTAKKKGPPQSPAISVNMLVVNNQVTPDGDGLHDYLVFKELDQFQHRKLAIFDQLGRAVFKTDQYDNQWDGRHSNGSYINGIYFYVLETEKGRKSGRIVVVR